MINKYTEAYFVDALRFAQYVAGNFGGTIADILTTPDGFPVPAPKGYDYPAEVHALRVGNIQIAYLTTDLPTEKDRKHRDRNLYRFVMGEQIMDMRLSKGISLSELSALTGYSRTTLDSLEHGRFRADVQILSAVAQALGCTLRLVEKEEN